MKRISWGWILVCVLLLGGLLGYLYHDRKTQALSHYLQGLKASRAKDWQVSADELSEAIRVAPPFWAEKSQAYNCTKGGPHGTRQRCGRWP